MFRVNAASQRTMATVSLAVVMLVFGGESHAGESSRLAYVRGEGAEQCPDERALRAAVAVRLGYDPFVAWAKKTVHAHVEGDGAGLRARIYLADEAGRAKGSRELRAPSAECEKLIAAAALAISIAIDPMSANGPRPAEAPGETTPPREEQTANTGSEPSNVTPSNSPTDKGAVESDTPNQSRDVPPWAGQHRSTVPTRAWHVGLGPHLASGTAPSVAAGLSAFLRFNTAGASLALEARYDLPASSSGESISGVVESKLLLLSLEPCVQFSPLSLCGLASLGSLEASGAGIAIPVEKATLYWAVGGRAVFERTVLDPLALRAHVDLVGNATRTTLALGGLEVWRAPILAAAVGVDAVARIW